MSSNGNITWSKKLYTGAAAKRCRRLIQRDIRRGKARLETYLIILREGAESPEMYHNSILTMSHYADLKFRIIGIAEGKREGLKLMGRIIEDVYRKDTGLNYREYFSDNS